MAIHDAEKERPLSQDAGITDVILPAGGRIAGDFAAAAGTDIKALIRLDGQTILGRTIETLRATGRVGRIAVIGPEAALTEAQRYGADGALPEGDTGPENIFRGIDWLQTHSADTRRHALIMPTDLPFVTPDSLVRFLDACPPEADIAVPVVFASDFEAMFPGTSSVFVPLKEGAVTLGCAFRLRPETLLRNRAHLDRIFEARKSQIAMAKLLGPLFILRYLTHQLTVSHIEARCRSLLGCTGAAVAHAPAELAYDIDLPEEYAYACAHAAGRKESSIHERGPEAR